MVRGSVIQVSYTGGSAYYTFQVSELLKPRDTSLPPRITIADPHWRSTAMIHLNKGQEALVFLSAEGEYFRSSREIDLAAPAGQETLLGVRLFLRIMYTPGAATQQKLCLDTWDSNLSDPEKQAVLDAMWETKTPLYSEVLLNVARGKDSPRVREWAITILSYIPSSQHVEELVPLLLSDPDYSVKRQLLLLFGTYRVQEAVPAIDELLNSNQGQLLLPWQMDSLRMMAEEARDKITGKNTSRYWKN